MISSIDNKKGIYKNLYKEIGVQKVNSAKFVRKNESFTAVRVPKGIYTNLYREIGSKGKKSIWHQYPFKLFVYSNDFGEALRPVLGSLVAKASWIISLLYAFMSINHKKTNAVSDEHAKAEKRKEIKFQFLASFLLPFILIKSTRKGAEMLLDRIPQAQKNNLKKYFTQNERLNKFISKFEHKNISGHRNLFLAGVGVAAIVAGAKPIDNLVRKAFIKEGKKEICA